MASPIRKRKREIQDGYFDEFSFLIGSCGLNVKRRRKTMLAPAENQRRRSPRLSPPVAGDGRENTHQQQVPTVTWKPPTDITPIFTPSKRNRKDTLRGTLRRRMSMTIMKKKMRTFQDYSLPYNPNLGYMDRITVGFGGQLFNPWILKDVRTNACLYRRLCRQDGTTMAEYKDHIDRMRRDEAKLDKHKDHDLQQKIDHEIKMREGTAKLLAASKHPAQMIEAAKNLLTSNTRIMAYMTELQKRKTAEVLGRNTSVEGNQLPCRAKVSVSDIRIPLMWKDSDHFKNKGDYRRYAVFCLLRIGTDIYETSLINNVDRSMTDLTFDDIIVFHNVPHDFTCKFEVYCHKLHEDLTIASTPKKIRKKINDLSGSVGRSVGKRLSGLNDSDILSNMVLGPRFELMASGMMELKDVEDSVGTFDLQIEPTSEGGPCELPLFGVYCLRLAAQPDCLMTPTVTGYLNLQDDEDKVKRYWCSLKNLQLSCWSSSGDVEVTDPLLRIPVTKNSQISEADPRCSPSPNTFHIKTIQKSGSNEHTLVADSKEDLNRWWDGLQQHLLDQALWKHACDNLIPIKSPSPHKKPVFLRKSSIYDETPLQDKKDSRPNSMVGELQKEDDQLSKMLTTLMGEAKQIRGDQPYSTTV